MTTIDYIQKHRSLWNKSVTFRRIRYKHKLMEILGNKCVKCGFSDWRGLQFDHIKGGGTKDFTIRFKGSGDAMYRYYLNHPEEAKMMLQLLCANCNQIKRYENGEGVRKDYIALWDKVYG